MRKRKRSHQTGPAMASEGETSGDDVPGLFDPDDEDNMPLDRLFNRGDDQKPSPNGAITAQTPVNRLADPDQGTSDEVRDYGRPLVDEGADEEHATAMGQSGDEGDDKDEWLTGSESFPASSGKFNGASAQPST